METGITRSSNLFELTEIDIQQMTPAEEWYSSQSLENLMKHKERLEQLLARERGEIILKAPVMPWMVDTWSNGLEIINQIITQKENART